MAEKLYMNPLKLQLPHADIKSAAEIRSVFGDHNGPLGLLTWAGHLHAFSMTSNSKLSLTQRGEATSPKLSHVAIASTGRTAIIMLQACGSRIIHILEFENFQRFEKWYDDPTADVENDASQSFKHQIMDRRAMTLQAGATCFILLTEEGEVFSWGDGRHPRCLGRTPNVETPANKPCLVGALGGINIAKIDGRGWVFGALSKENDLYLWGRDKPSTELSLWGLLGGKEDEVKLLDDERFEDVTDFAVGNGHVVVATTGGDVFAYGENRNGQLGLKSGTADFALSWEKLVSKEDGCSIAVIAGDTSTFVLSSESLWQ
jgi:hypothetical protein